MKYYIVINCHKFMLEKNRTNLTSLRNNIYNLTKEKRHLVCFQFTYDKMEQNVYHTVVTVPKSNRKFVERGNIEALNTYTHNRWLSWISTDISIKSDGVKLVI